MSEEQHAAAGAEASRPPPARGRRLAGLILVALAAGVLLAVSLGGHALWDPDEAKHAEVAREMLISGNWVEPHVAFQPYHHKPSLLYLLIGSSYRLFGVSEFSARLVPALAGWLTLLATYWFASGVGLRAGLLAALLLAACPLFVGVSRFTNFDGLVTCFTTAAALWLAAWLDAPTKRSIYPVYLFVGLGVLAKGPMALVVVIVPLLVCWLLGEHRWRDLAALRGALLLLVIVGVWAVPVGLAAPDYLLDFVWIHNVQRYLVPQRAFHPEPFYFFIPILLGALLPWSLLLPRIGRDAFRAGGGSRFLILYALWVVVFFSISSGKLATYVLPAIPALAVLAGRWLDGPAGDEQAAARTLLDLAAFLLALLLPSAGFVIGREAPNLLPLAAVFVPVTVAGLWLLWRGRKLAAGLRAATVTLCGGLLATLFVFNAVGGPAVSRLTSDADLAAAARAIGRPDRMVAFGVRPYSFLFYTGWPIVYQGSDEELRDALHGGGRVLLLSKEKQLARLDEVAGTLSLSEIARNGRHVLYRVASSAPSEPTQP